MTNYSGAALQIIGKWFEARPFKLAGGDKNLELIYDAVNKFYGGKFTFETLDKATEIQWARLTFERGKEMGNPMIAQRRVAQEARAKAEAASQRKAAEQTAKQRQVNAPARINEITNDAQQLFKDSQDINSELFINLQKQNRLEFHKICNEYVRFSPSGRQMFALTEERRERLRAINIVDERRDKDGNEVVRYDKMIEAQKKLLQRFENEDARL
jgi:hypothetical protein